MLRREGAAFPPGILVWVGDPNTVQLGWPGIPANGEVLVVLHFRGLPSTVAVNEYHGDGMYPGFLLGGVLAKSAGAGGGVEDLAVLPPSAIAGPPFSRRRRVVCLSSFGNRLILNCSNGLAVFSLARGLCLACVSFSVVRATRWPTRTTACSWGGGGGARLVLHPQNTRLARQRRLAAW